jgi:ethanolamine utilization microcompartment shell protein EutS
MEQKASAMKASVPGKKITLLHVTPNPGEKGWRKTPERWLGFERSPATIELAAL